MSNNSITYSAEVQNKQERYNETLRRLTMSVAEAAELLGVSLPIMYGLCNSTDCSFVIRLGRKIRIHAPSFEAWMMEQAQACK